jgi:hypothetical protein
MNEKSNLFAVIIIYLVYFIIFIAGDGKIGTPVTNEANRMPNDINVIVPTTLARMTVIVIAVGLLTLHLDWILNTIVSKIGDIPIERPTRTGRTMLLNTQNPAYMAKNPFHCPGANGDRPVLITKKIK